MTIGQYPGIQMPAIAGSDGSGTIDEVGAGMPKDCLGSEVVIYPALEWGDDPLCGGKNFRVLGMPDQGTFAEYICVPKSSIYAKLSIDRALRHANVLGERTLIRHTQHAEIFTATKWVISPL